MNSRVAAIAALEDRIGYVFKDRQLLERALTHASVGGRRAGQGHNEALEFLGDRVLGLLAAEALVQAFPGASEGELNQRFVVLVNGRSCARMARLLKLGPAIRLDSGASKAGARENDRILGDALEALLAAIYLEGGLDNARDVFVRIWRETLREVGHQRDAKTRLQEWAMARRLPLPRYVLIGRTGAEHSPRFNVSVAVEGCAAATGDGATIRAAQTAAAEALLNRENISE